MTHDRAAGTALIFGSAAVLLVMALHPTSHDIMSAVGRSPWPARINLAVHSLAIASAPVLFFGALGIARRLAAAAALSQLALVAFGFAMVAVIVAAIMSGMLSPALVERIATSSGPERDMLGAQLHLVGSINQAFAKTHVALGFGAIALWSVATLRAGGLPRWLGWMGVAVATLVLLALFSGHARFDVHGFGLLMLAQSAWLVAAGWIMRIGESISHESRVGTGG